LGRKKGVPAAQSDQGAVSGIGAIHLTHQWWLKQLKNSTTRSALLVNPRPNLARRKV
jgi:hypothetical protein